MGYADLKAFGDSEIPTPHIDRLCNEGTRFTNAYVTAPICVPSRMGLLSARYPARYGIYGNVYKPDEVRLFEQEPLLVDVFRQGGYRTALVGKWHLGGNGQSRKERLQLQPLRGGPLPQERGFDESITIAGGMDHFVEGTLLYRHREPFPAPEYLTEFFGKEAAAFVERNKARPFFLYLAFNAVHAPLEAPEADIARLEGIVSPDRRIYAAMLHSMDRSIGYVLAKLREHELEKNTVVVFLNDNGGAGNHTPEHSRNTGRNVPLRGYKFDLFEGGIRVPMVLRWPGHVPGGKVYDKLVSSLDVLPTLIAAAGLELPPGRVHDGVDLLPFLTTSTGSIPHRELFWKTRAWDGPPHRQGSIPGVHHAAVRRGHWKMVKLNEPLNAPAPAPWALYDLARDVGEQHDVAGEYPDVVRDLKAAYLRWLEEMHPSLERVKKR